MRTLRWLLRWNNPPAAPPPPPPQQLLSYDDVTHTRLPLLDLAVRSRASHAIMRDLLEAGGRPPVQQLVALMPGDRVAELWWLLAPPAYRVRLCAPWFFSCVCSRARSPCYHQWKELLTTTAQHGDMALLAYMLQRAPRKEANRTKLLCLALASADRYASGEPPALHCVDCSPRRPMAEMLMREVRVRDKALIGAAIHGEMYDVALALALQGAKQTELYNGRPLVLQLAGSPFLPPQARALWDVLLSPADAQLQAWLSIALNVPHQGELPLCAAVGGDDMLYRVARLLKAGAKPDHSDAAGAHTRLALV